MNITSAPSNTWVFILIIFAIACMATGVRAQDTLDRTVLPLAEPTYPPISELDVRKATPPPRFEVKAADGAPNVLVILLDNLGFGATKPFGGVIEMPTLERLAKDGLIYNNFHTAPLCSPSRVALLTGHNPHSANMGSVAGWLLHFRAKLRNVPIAWLPCPRS
jgi:Sulfatase